MRMQHERDPAGKDVDGAIPAPTEGVAVQELRTTINLSVDHVEMAKIIGESLGQPVES